MRIIFALKAALEGDRYSGQALWYTATQLAVKAVAAVTQLYTIYVFSKIHTPPNAAMIFILLGYAIWIQVFEFGVSQVIQNGINTKVLRVIDACRIIVMHYIVMAIFAVLIVMFPKVLALFQGEGRVYEGGMESHVFPIGVALMLVATNNALMQRMLLMLNRSMLVSKLIFLQAVVGILVLSIFQWRGASLIESVTIYFAIPFLIYAPLVLRCAKKIWQSTRKSHANWWWVFKNALGFWGLTTLSSIYLGADYFFAANYLDNAEIIAYHFSSRLFFISYVAYFSYVQYKARSINNSSFISNPPQIWSVVKASVFIGVFSIILILCAVGIIKWSGGLAIIGAQKLLVMPLILSAALYYGIRVLRDVGLVIVWNFGFQKLLYVVHFLEVIGAFLLLKILAPKLGGVGIFFAMTSTAAFSTFVIYIALRQMQVGSKFKLLK